MDHWEQIRAQTWVERVWRWRKGTNDVNARALAESSQLRHIPEAIKYLGEVRARYERQIEQLRMGIQQIDKDIEQNLKWQAQLREPYEAEILALRKLERIDDIDPILRGEVPSEPSLEEKERAELARLKAKYES